MNKMIRKLKSEMFYKILYLILFIQVGLIAYTNFVLIESHIDCDSAKLFVHAIEMWRNGTPIISGWSGVSTLELDCSTLLAVPIYGITQNIYVAFAISNVVFLILLISVIFYLFNKEETKLYAIISSILICIPYRMGMLDYFNMMYFNGSQYIIKVIIPILLLALLVHTESGKGDRIKFIVFSIIYGILLFTSCLSSGIYIMLCGVLPVMGASYLWRIFNEKRITLRFIISVLETFIIGGAGYFLYSKFQIGSKGNEMKLMSVYDGLVENFNSCIIAVFELFGGVAYDEVKVMSYEGINILIRMVFVAILFICAIAVIVKLIKQRAEQMSIVLATVFWWNTFILGVCNTKYGSGTFEYRYHLIGAISLIILSSKSVVNWIKEQPKKILIGAGVSGFCLIVFLVFGSWKAIYSTEIDNSMYREICEYTEEVGADYVYFLYESQSAEICRLIDHENALYFQLMGDGEIWVYDYYSQYDKTPMIQENFIVLCDNKIYDFGDEMEMYGYIFSRSKIIGTKSVYEVTGIVK